MLSWMNGQFMLAEEMKISPLEHGYLYGIGFFETFRTYEGVPVFLEEHFARLTEALHAYNMRMPYSLDDMKHVIEVLNESAGGEDGYFRLNVAAGNYGLGLQPLHYDDVTVIVFRKELTTSPVVIPKQAHWLEHRRNSPEQSIRYKSHHFGNNVLARQELPNLGQYEGIFLTKDGYVAEGVTANVFWVKDGILYTPEISLGILPGITRKIVIELAAILNMTVVEGRFLPQMVEEAEELFVTNSIQEIVPIAQLSQKQYAADDGTVYRKLLFAYRHHIARIVEGELTS